MAVATVTQKQLIDNYACLILLEFPTGLSIGDSFTVADVGAPFNGTFTVYAMPEYLFMGVNLEGEIVVDPLYRSLTKFFTLSPEVMSIVSLRPVR